MDGPVISFRAKVDHGCLVLRDVQGDDDISEWDPSSAKWYRSGNSIVFGVLPGSEGWVECEVWKSPPVAPLPISLFVDEILSQSGWLVIHDPNEHVRMQFRGPRGLVKTSVRVDDADFASEVQIIVESATV
jgi:hypothetical protein